MGELGEAASESESTKGPAHLYSECGKQESNGKNVSCCVLVLSSRSHQAARHCYTCLHGGGIQPLSGSLVIVMFVVLTHNTMFGLLVLFIKISKKQMESCLNGEMRCNRNWHPAFLRGLFFATFPFTTDQRVKKHRDGCYHDVLHVITQYLMVSKYIYYIPLIKCNVVSCETMPRNGGGASIALLSLL